MACYLGPFSDTVWWEVASNNFAFHVVIANGHQHQILGADFENTTAPPVTGGVSGFPACKGVLIMGDNASNTWGNRIISSYFRQVGNAIELYGVPTQSRIMGNTFRSNTNIFTYSAGTTKTYGEIDGAYYATAFNIVA